MHRTHLISRRQFLLFGTTAIAAAIAPLRAFGKAGVVSLRRSPLALGPKALQELPAVGKAPNPEGSIAASARPASYDSFVTVKEEHGAQQAITGNRYVYFPPGTYEFDNPVIIDRSEPLFIHGGSRMGTILRPRNPALPLFVVRSGSLINFANLYLLNPGVPEHKTLVFENTSPIDFEMQDCFLDGAVLDMAGPGSYRLQGTFVTNRGLSRSPLVVDHPLADFLAVGGNMHSGDGRTVTVPAGDLFNVWQRRGRVRLYGVGVQKSVGLADFRIDAASQLGPHVFAYIRSEGTNGYRSGRLGSAFLLVPHSRERVDVLMMANAGLWPSNRKNRRLNHFLNYGASGTVWMIGNSAPRAVDHMAVGDAPDATIVAMGNRIFSGTNDPIPIRAKVKYNVGNTFTGRRAFSDIFAPRPRFLHAQGTVDAIDTVPPIPEVPLPEPLQRPVLHRALPGMLDVKKDFGAKGDGISDDTKALQKALVSGKEIFFPAGIYRTRETLGFNHSVYGGKALGPGGWIGGAGKNSTIIRRDARDKGSVFATEGMAYITIQGISFETADFDPGSLFSTEASAAELEFNPRFPGAFATQEVMFYDCRFRGGRYAASIGLRTGKMGSENMFIECEFVNAGYGLAIGSYNALNNIAYGSSFKDNEITIGQDPRRRSGGSGSLLKSDVSGTKIQEIAIFNTSGEPWYFNGVKSDTRRLVSTKPSGIPFELVFDQCEFDPQPPTRSLGHFLSGGGLFFIHSTINSGYFDISSSMSAVPLFSLESNFKDIGMTKLGPNARIFRLRRAARSAS